MYEKSVIVEIEAGGLRLKSGIALPDDFDLEDFLKGGESTPDDYISSDAGTGWFSTGAPGCRKRAPAHPEY